MTLINPKALTAARERKGWTQNDLSEATKPQIAISTISRLERGKPRRVRQRTLNELARVLDIEPSQLCEEQRESERDLMKLPIDSAARNALTLVARRYGVSRQQIVEIAPLLFLVAAEGSLHRRREKLRELQDAAAGLPFHLPRTRTVGQHILDEEERSIRERDLFGSIVSNTVEWEVEGVGGPEDPDWEESEQNPFAVFLTESLDAFCPSSDPVSWYPKLAPRYELCRDEAAALVGGDDEATIAILIGSAALHEMPKEVRDGSPADRATWARAARGKWLDELGIKI